jgi:hypothetical protein
MLEHYRERVAGTNIDPRSLLSTDYFNSFNTVIMLFGMLFGMLPDAPELLDEIDQWKFLSYVEHFKESGLDFAPLAIEAYDHVPANLKAQFEVKLEIMRMFVEESRAKLRKYVQEGKTGMFGKMAVQTSRELQKMADGGAAIVHGHDAAIDQSTIDKLF